MHRSIPALVALLALSACSAEPAAPPPAPAALTASVEAQEARVHPAAAAFGAYTGPEHATLMITEEGVGAVQAGVADLRPYTVTSTTDSALVLVTDDGTEYRVDLDQHQLSSSALPELTLSRM